MKIVATLFCIISALTLGTSCQRCSSCTLTKTQKMQNDEVIETKEVDEYCGDELKDIEEMKKYSKSGVDYAWSCE